MRFSCEFGMTGGGHRLTGIGAALMAASLATVLGLPEWAAGVVALLATTLPDWSEIPFYRDGVRYGSLIPHRTITHWPPLWVGVIVWAHDFGGLAGGLAVGASVGALVHILGDAPNPMGIPWLWPTKRLRLGWWRSGQHELLMVIVFAAVGYGCWLATGHPPFLSTVFD